MEYSDGDIDYCNEACAAAMMHGDAPGGSVDALFRDTSYGRVSFPATHTSVVTVKIDKPVSGLRGCPYDSMGVDADAAATALDDPAYDPALFTHRVYIMPSNDIGCGNVAGIAYTGACDYGKGSSSCKAWIRAVGPDSSPASVLAHELGHNLGVKHASTAARDPFAGGAEGLAAAVAAGSEDNTVGSTYGDHSGIMGNGAALVGFTAPNRHSLGWLNGANDVLDHPADCTVEPTQTVASLELTPGSGRGYSAITVGRLLGGKYWISYRAGAAGGFDAGLAAAYANRLSIHYHLGGPSSTVLLATLAPAASGPGGTFEGTSAVTKAAFTVTFVGVSDAGSAQVSIDFGCGGSTAAPTVNQPLPTTWNGGVCADQAKSGWEYQGQPLGCLELRAMGYCASAAAISIGAAVVDDCPVTCGVCSPAGGRFAANPFAEAAMVLSSSEQTCGLELMRSEIKTCHATGHDAAGPCGCTAGDDRVIERQTKVNKPCVEDARSTCAGLNWLASAKGVCYATNVVAMKPSRAVVQCKKLKKQKLNLGAATDYCEAVGARLCTQAEVAAQPAKSHSASCKKDTKRRVWTSTPCGTPSSGKVVMVKAKRTWCTPPTSKFKGSQRCCADVVLPSADLYILPGWSKSNASDGESGDKAAAASGSATRSGSGSGGGGIEHIAATATPGGKYGQGDDDGSRSPSNTSESGGTRGDGDNVPVGPGSILAIVVIVSCCIIGSILLVRRHSHRHANREFGSKLSDVVKGVIDLTPSTAIVITGGNTESDDDGCDGSRSSSADRSISGGLRASEPAIRRTSNFAEANLLTGESTSDAGVERSAAPSIAGLNEVVTGLQQLHVHAAIPPPSDGASEASVDSRVRGRRLSNLSSRVVNFPEADALDFECADDGDATSVVLTPTAPASPSRKSASRRPST
jgi:hypothetical protein